MKNYTIAQKTNTPIGTIRLAASEIGLTMVALCGKEPAKTLSTSGAELASVNKIIGQVMEEITEYLIGQRKEFSVPIDWSSVAPFQKRVLEAALRIPYGDFQTYGAIALDLGNKNASRAVGAALGRNPMPLVIPCHRVVSANRHLTGFSAADGIKTKQWLLELEGHQVVAQKLV